MKLIDDKLGGTTPLDVIIKFPGNEKSDETEDDFDGWDDDSLAIIKECYEVGEA